MATYISGLKRNVENNGLSIFSPVFIAPLLHCQIIHQPDYANPAYTSITYYLFYILSTDFHLRPHGSSQLFHFRVSESLFNPITSSAPLDSDLYLWIPTTTPRNLGFAAALEILVGAVQKILRLSKRIVVLFFVLLSLEIEA